MINFFRKLKYKGKELQGAYIKLWTAQIGVILQRHILAEQKETVEKLEAKIKEASQKEKNWEEEKELKLKLAQQEEEINGNKALKKTGTQEKLEILLLSEENLLLLIKTIKEL